MEVQTWAGDEVLTVAETTRARLSRLGDASADVRAIPPILPSTTSHFARVETDPNFRSSRNVEPTMSVKQDGGEHALRLGSSHPPDPRLGRSASPERRCTSAVFERRGKPTAHL
jgi:hypothetical protein